MNKIWDYCPPVRESAGRTFLFSAFEQRCQSMGFSKALEPLRDRTATTSFGRRGAITSFGNVAKELFN